MSASSWGPFVPNIDWPERKARVRALRTCVRLLTGERGKAAAFALLRIEVQGPEQELMDGAAAEFDKLASLDRRRVLSSYQGLL